MKIILISSLVLNCLLLLAAYPLYRRSQKKAFVRFCELMKVRPQTYQDRKEVYKVMRPSKEERLILEGKVEESYFD